MLFRSTVNALEARVAALLGFEAGLFTPTGSLANQLGLRLLVAPGQELVCDSLAHIARAELGAAGAGGATRTTSSTGARPPGLATAAGAALSSGRRPSWL